VKKDEFESELLDLWVTTAIPLTMDNLGQHTGAPPRAMRAWLEQLMLDGVVEMGSDDHGELLFTVTGAKRALDGPRTLDERSRLETLKREVSAEYARKQARRKAEAAASAATDQTDIDSALEDLSDTPGAHDNAAATRTALQKMRSRYNATTAMSIVESTRKELKSGRDEGDKSLLLSSALSFFFGPLGWLYAGSFREAIPASAAFLLLVYLLPWFLIYPVLGLAMPISGIAGLVYAWQHNRNGERDPLFLDD
jgi:hypothetical protein